jgi:hypothetical protein
VVPAVSGGRGKAKDTAGEGGRRQQEDDKESEDDEDENGEDDGGRMRRRLRGTGRSATGRGCKGCVERERGGRREEKGGRGYKNPLRV